MAKPEGRYSLVAEDHNALSDEQLGRLYRPGVRVPWVVVTTMITALASVLGTYYATGHGSSVDCASKADLHALDTHVAELSHDVATVVTTMGRNADQAHNDTRDIAVELHSYINSHAK